MWLERGNEAARTPPLGRLNCIYVLLWNNILYKLNIKYQRSTASCNAGCKVYIGIRKLGLVMNVLSLKTEFFFSIYFLQEGDHFFVVEYRVLMTPTPASLSTLDIFQVRGSDSWRLKIRYAPTAKAQDAQWVM